MKKPFIDEAVKLDAEKIVNEKMLNFWTAIMCIFILFMCAAVGFSIGATVGEKEGRKEMIQELCAKQQYDFCVVKKVIYSIKEEK